MASLVRFRSFLEKHTSVYLDTSIFIYHLEDAQPYSDLTQVIFDFLEADALKASTSVLSFLELNTKPYQMGRVDKALAHVALLKNMRNLSLLPMDIEIADRAAQLRAEYRLKTPDTIHLASAIISQNEVVVGNDKDLKKVKEIPCVALDNFL